MKNIADLYGLSVTVISSIVDCIAPRLDCVFDKCIYDVVFPDLTKQQTYFFFNLAVNQFLSI